jgi:hypothetical protein
VVVRITRKYLERHFGQRKQIFLRSVLIFFYILDKVKPLDLAVSVTIVQATLQHYGSINKHVPTTHTYITHILYPPCRSKPPDV